MAEDFPLFLLLPPLSTQEAQTPKDLFSGSREARCPGACPPAGHAGPKQNQLGPQSELARSPGSTPETPTEHGDALFATEKTDAVPILP